ncbi:hypothetical protein AWB91_17630 [Mycobacterium paraense]|uniref:Uncharacterized protein n=1 Tax=Mycobacterium paraense TaxID=767916 RepID=A0ABX3VNS8_9MYCO|nr:hypothetical protein [Mycobacterium paraense]MCV7441570.1 hypothetical protein [Mycobacterium paraense]ORW30805.1 hypothetical protein AWB91_17630 [Mycobacterium paraense]ORW41447.1 hypothetical protein AWB89_02005 [Mycobacterium paraense]ORW42314.1 hypothetical protein AWB88_09645 [Mycobacterium paraense]
MTTAIPADALDSGSPMNGHEGADGESVFGHGTAVATRTTTLAWRVETVVPRWRPSEDEIVRAAITVILVALGTIIALAAMAILTMG